LLDSIAMALGGKDCMPAEPLRRGANNGQVEVTLDDGLVVKRTFTPGGGGALTVTSKDGARYPSPQKILDSLVGNLSFDPLAFSRMDRKAQAQTLRDLVGLDFSELDTKRKAAFDQRTGVNREVKRLEGALSSMPPVPAGTPKEETSIDYLAIELERRRATNVVREKEERELARLRTAAIDRKKRITDIESELAAEREALAAITETGLAQAAKISTLPAALDESEIVERMKSVGAINAAVRALHARTAVEQELEKQYEVALSLTGEIQRIDDEKREKLESKKMPIEGLGLDDGYVSLNGLPLDQASGAEQLRACVAICIALHPKLKVLLVRDGSLLDEASLELVAEMAEAAEAQVWMERVGKGGECSIVIEDGMVAVDAANQDAGREPGSDG